ncbi:hypothetical protein [Cystobacter fuscus]|nr:hypothetical protein [Cystobacter fuscus]
MTLTTALVLASSGCAHSQRPESRIHVVSEQSEGVGSALGSGGSGGYDCNDEFKKCMKVCWDKRYPWPHNKRQSGWYHERCEQDCNRAFNEYEDEKKKEEERQGKLTFSHMDEAIDWIKNHKAEVMIGTVVIVAGVAFVLSTGGYGTLILAPLAL